MELCLVHNDPLRTPLVAAGARIYEITTPKDPPRSPTTIIRIESEVSTGHIGTEIGKIEYRGSQTILRLSSCSSYQTLTVELSLCSREMINQE
jgi:hypothetical protein